MLFEGWMPPVRTLVVAVLGYAAPVTMLRAAGKRTLSKWNEFDSVVTFAIGSTPATVLVSKETMLAQGVTALAVPIGLQSCKLGLDPIPLNQP